MGGALCRRQPTRVIIQGLDCAGKTSLLYRLKLGEIVTTIPTIGFNVETLHAAGLEITAWDLGGRDKIRPLYRHYYTGSGGFIYILDSADVERLDDALDEMNRMIIMGDETRDCVLMVLANKQDLDNALSPADIEDRIRTYLDKNSGEVHLAMFVMPCTVTEMKNESVSLAFDYFAKMLKKKKEGMLDNGFHRSAWEMTTSQGAESKTTADDVTLFGKFKYSILKEPLTALKSLLFY